MARLRELPFGRYYGGVDTTPLFVMLAGAYAARTGDLALIDELWPSLLAAMGWIEGDGDSNRRRLRRLRARRGDRARQPGLEGQRGFRLRRRRRATRKARWRWSRCRATSTRRSGPWPSWRLGAATRPTRAPPGAPRRSACASRSRSASGSRSWAPTPSPWTAAASPAGCAPPIPGTCCSPGCPRRSAAERVADQLLGGGLQYRLGHPHAGRGRAALQPDVLPQRLGLAARHRALHRRAGALRRPRRRGGAAERHVRDRGQVRHAPARAVLRLRARAPASRRSPIPWPACRRPGRRARCS